LLELPTFDLEARLQQQGFSPVAGVDEAGRGPLAGPVVAAAVILPPELSNVSEGPLPPWLGLVDDSKALTASQRQRALEHIESHAIAIGLGVATHQEIDAEGIGEATRWAMRRAVDTLPLKPSYLLIDFVKLPECGIPFHAPAHGDSLSYSISAASIVAKVSRDRMMEAADAIYPGYEFARHKGYPTPQHLRLLALRGPSPIHRHSFRPLRPGVSAKDRRSSRKREVPSGGAA
jgi:ribonuclease HII